MTKHGNFLADTGSAFVSGRCTGRAVILNGAVLPAGALMIAVSVTITEPMSRAGAFALWPGSTLPSTPER